MYTTTKKTGIHHVCLKVPDLARTATFYMEGLGARFVVEWGKDGASDHAILVDLGDGDFLEIFESDEEFGVGKWQHVAVRTDNIELSVQKAVAAGATPLGPVRDADIPARSGEIVRMRFGFVQSPGGEVIEFIEDE